MRMTSDYREGVSIGWLTTPTPIVKRLCIINAVVFGLELVAVYTNHWSYFADYLALSGKSQQHGMIWQFVTYMFLHDPRGFPWHILLNLLALWMFGRDVEVDLGARKFLKLYFAGGILGGLFWLAFNFQGPGCLLGASGAVLAVCIAYATLYPDRPITILLFFILPITMKAKYWAWLIVALVAYGCFRVSSNVADLAHLGGICVGYLYVKWLGWGGQPTWMTAIQRWFPSRRRNRLGSSPDPGSGFSVGRANKRPLVRRLFGKWTNTTGKPKRTRRSLSKEEFIRREVDPILEKIQAHGIQSLTPRERQILEEAGKKMSERI